MSRKLIVGAGPVGTALACDSPIAGDRVRIVTRSGRGPEHPDIDRVTLDGSDATALAGAAAEASVVFNCANPGFYPEWERVWPPLAASILRTAETVDAVSLGARS